MPARSTVRSPRLWNIQATRAGDAEVAAVLLDDVADVGDGAVAVVGERLHQHGDAARAVALVRDLLVA